MAPDEWQQALYQAELIPLSPFSNCELLHVYTKPKKSRWQRSYKLVHAGALQHLATSISESRLPDYNRVLQSARSELGAHLEPTAVSSPFGSWADSSELFHLRKLGLVRLVKKTEKWLLAKLAAHACAAISAAGNRASSAELTSKDTVVLSLAESEKQRLIGRLAADGFVPDFGKGSWDGDVHVQLEHKNSTSLWIVTELLYAEAVFEGQNSSISGNVKAGDAAEMASLAFGAGGEGSSGQTRKGQLFPWAMRAERLRYGHQGVLLSNEKGQSCGKSAGNVTAAAQANSQASAAQQTYYLQEEDIPAPAHGENAATQGRSKDKEPNLDTSAARGTKDDTETPPKRQKIQE